MSFNDHWIQKIPICELKKRFETVEEYLKRGGQITKCDKISYKDWISYTKPKKFNISMGI